MLMLTQRRHFFTKRDVRSLQRSYDRAAALLEARGVPVRSDEELQTELAAILIKEAQDPILNDNALSAAATASEMER